MQCGVRIVLALSVCPDISRFALSGYGTFAPNPTYGECGVPSRRTIMQVRQCDV